MCQLLDRHKNEGNRVFQHESVLPIAIVLDSLIQFSEYVCALKGFMYKQTLDQRTPGPIFPQKTHTKSALIPPHSWPKDSPYFVGSFSQHEILFNQDPLIYILLPDFPQLCQPSPGEHGLRAIYSSKVMVIQ